jgi:hypothetical protein
MTVRACRARLKGIEDVLSQVIVDISELKADIEKMEDGGDS